MTIATTETPEQARREATELVAQAWRDAEAALAEIEQTTAARIEAANERRVSKVKQAYAEAVEAVKRIKASADFEREVQRAVADAVREAGYLRYETVTPELVRVRSLNGDEVTWEPRSGWSCTCGAATKRTVACDHARAAMERVSWRTAEKMGAAQRKASPAQHHYGSKSREL